MNECTIGCATPTFGFENGQGRTKHSLLSKCISIKLNIILLESTNQKLKAYENWENMLLLYLYVTSSCRPFKSFLLEDNDIHYLGYKKIIQYRERCSFSSCHERGTKKKFWVPTRNRTSDLWIPRFDALPLSHRDYYEVDMTCILYTARISNIDRVMFVDRNKRDG